MSNLTDRFRSQMLDIIKDMEWNAMPGNNQEAMAPAAPTGVTPGTDFSSNPLYVTPDFGDEGPQNTYAAIEEAQEQDYENRFLPHEIDLYNSMGNPEQMREQVTRSGNLAGAGMDNAKAQAERKMKSYGTELNRMQRSEFDSRFNRNRQVAQVDARNSARMAKKERDMRTLAGGANLNSETNRGSVDV